MDKKLETIIKGLVKAKINSRPNLINVKRRLSNQQKMPSPLNSDLLKVYQKLLKNKKIKSDKNLERLLRKREIRTLSGVAVITVITKAYPCPGKCIYCPNELGMPKSYLSNEPAVMRAIGTKFDPWRQVSVRLEALKNNGHNTDKIELIVLGGSWSAYPKSYQTNFIKRCFDALNGKTAKTLAQAQKLNEKAKHRCVGLTLETRPDMIDETEIKRMRELGCTRVELGVQSLDDKILKLNQRGHTVKQTITATRLLKQAGFKVMYHLMPNLPGSTPAKDLKMFKELFANPDFQPDLLKIYPCVVTKNSILYQWYKQDKYKPYSDKQLKKLLIEIKQIIPCYVRITRLIRDIPAESIIAGNKITNLRQIIANEFKNCKCIRCREAGHQEINSKSQIRPFDSAQVASSGAERRNPKQILRQRRMRLWRKNSKFQIQKYQASGGTEYFLSYESKDRKVLYAFLRLRIPCHSEGPRAKSRGTEESKIYKVLPELIGAALIRELHTYGELAPLGKTGKVQHLGLGKKLMAEAEKIVKNQGVKKTCPKRLVLSGAEGSQRIAIISGIGVRPYYQKLGYQLTGTYMIKNL